MLKEFKDFISKGNVIDMAVAVIMASTFGAIVTSLVDDIIMPIIGALIAGIDFKEFTLSVAGVELGVGKFINAIIIFLIVAFVMFLIVKAFNKIKKRKEVEEEVTTKECSFCKTEIHIDATRCPHCTSELK